LKPFSKDQTKLMFSTIDTFLKNQWENNTQ